MKIEIELFSNSLFEYMNEKLILFKLYILN